MAGTATNATAAKGAGIVLLTLAASQFLMTLDTSVMNVAIATVAKDVSTSITGVQTAITMYTLVMAALMITGGKVGEIMGRKRAFAIGCVVYGAGSFVTAISTNLGVLILGWSVLEGIGAALILPALVALVSSNFPVAERSRAYGLLAAAAASAVAVGPLIGGLCTTYLTWRVVFFGEVVMVAVILVLTKRMTASPARPDVKLDLVGTVLSALGLGLVVFGILKAGSWGFLSPKPGGPELLGLSPVISMLIAGGLVLWGFLLWQQHRRHRGRATLLDPSLLRIRTLRAGMSVMFFDFLLQAGLFFAVPLFLTVALGVSAVETGVRILPLSAALLVSALGVPKLWPHVSPRRIARIGLLLQLSGIVVFMVSLERGAGAGIITWPMLLGGLGMGALASQLSAVTVSSAPDERSGEVGALQNTVTNLGSSIGTALSGAVLIAALSASFLTGITNNPKVPDEVASEASVQLTSTVAFVSDADLADVLHDAGVEPEVSAAIVDANTNARLDALREALAVLALIAVVALFVTRAIPTVPPGGSEPSREHRVKSG